MRLSNDLSDQYPLFKQREDERRRPSFTTIQKCTTAIRQLAYGISSDVMDEYLEMSEKVSRDSLHFSRQGIISIYPRKYLHKPTLYDIQRIYEVHNERHGLYEMLGSIDCTHVGWDMSNNDINVIEQSPIFEDIIDGVKPTQSFYANEIQFKLGYYMVDGIYNEWSTLVQAYASPVEDKQKYFKKK
ncbi:uncharacterized protein LOC143613492 [Bidens hawaiensis]|uniref:uncharacterized protein LOC143613492 n=1 Tax=Bidens hawaiensis TaxID=980011 RepID=UPI004049998E